MEEKKKQYQQQDEGEVLIRILGNDIPGSKSIYVALTKIKGVSWAIANLTCLKLNLSKSKKLSEFSKDELAKIESFLKNIDGPDYIFNRRSDIETGETKHFLGIDLDLKNQFDIKRLKKIRSYKGIRHAAKLPVRGQRTRSNFRKKGIAVGVKRKKK
jgi:small subunit ribosomal protein S13